MYKIGDTIYADAGHYLIDRGTICFFSINNDVTEVRIPKNDAVAVGEYIFFAGRKLAQKRLDNYADYKAALVKKVYSNDDQIAIMLNVGSGDAKDVLRYNKMQEWREWAGRLARVFVNLK